MPAEGGRWPLWNFLYGRSSCRWSGSVEVACLFTSAGFTSAITIQQGSLPCYPTGQDDVGTAPQMLYPQAAWPQLHVLSPIAETIQIPPHPPSHHWFCHAPHIVCEFFWRGHKQTSIHSKQDPNNRQKNRFHSCLHC